LRPQHAPTTDASRSSGASCTQHRAASRPSGVPIFLKLRVLAQEKKTENMEQVLGEARELLTEVDEVRVCAMGVPAFYPELRPRVEQLSVQCVWLIRSFDIEWRKRSPDMYHFYEISKMHEEYQRSHSERCEFWESKKQVAYAVIDIHLDKDLDLQITRRMLCAAHEELCKLLGE
jgi:hypothetical protein